MENKLNMGVFDLQDFEKQQKTEKTINAPTVVLVSIGVLVAIHALRQIISAEDDEWVILLFAFSPMRYWPLEALQGLSFPGGNLAKIWSFVSYSFLHADWTHLLMNCAWLLVFGALLARRIGAWRFVLLSGCAGAGGAVFNLLLYYNEVSFLVGASGAISGQMAGATRILFATSMGFSKMDDDTIKRLRPLSIKELFTDPRTLIFLGAWLGITLFFGAVNFGFAAEGGRISWEAHIGGFLTGLFMFPLVDRPAKQDEYISH